MNEIDISLLFEKPELDVSAILFIEPLAPLSMVVSMPGSYYRSQSEPSIYMIYGMLENAMGWHFSPEDRRKIISQIKKHLKKNFKYENIQSGSSEVKYLPIIQNHLLIEHPAFLQPYKQNFEDYWTQHLKDVDERHAKGNRNYDANLEHVVNEIYKLPKEERDKKWRETLENNTSKFPTYYQSPTKREYIDIEGKYGYKIKTNSSLFKLLFEKAEFLITPLYIGTNEGWVDIKIQMI